MRALFVAALATAGALFSGESSAAPEKRPVPDYDHRPPESTTATDVLVWPPRIVLFPLWVVHEYVLRKPIGAISTHAEKHHWPTHVIDFFTFGEERKAGISPTVFYEFGFKPSAGAYFWWDDAGFKGHEIRAHAGTWGPSYISTEVMERIRFRPGGRSMFAWNAEYIKRPDSMFFGLGPRSLESDISRFGFTRIGFAPRIELSLGEMSFVRGMVGIRSVSFRADDHCCGDPSIEEEVARGTYGLPPGFQGYTSIYQNLMLVLDSRKAGTEAYGEVPSGTGIRAIVEGEHAGDVRTSSAHDWVRYGGHLGGFVDLGSNHRNIGLVFSAEFTDPLHGQVPFTEQANLPYAGTVASGIVGIGPMRGFRPGRLIDRSYLAATVQYQWPIWIWLDGAIHAGIGNVFGEHLKDFDPNLLRLSAGFGVRTTGAKDHAFEAMIATGTETIKDGWGIGHIRVYGGFTRGF